ncbi:hypothetical protein FGB62_188g01 [Gracilaria domingensis]|nr:hypothetical protein FGB62_188g01 [Gracilaria domingensis]
MDGLVSVLSARRDTSSVENDELNRGTLQLEMFEAHARHTTSALEAIRKTMQMMDEARSVEDREVFKLVLDKLKANLDCGARMQSRSTVQNSVKNYTRKALDVTIEAGKAFETNLKTAEMAGVPGKEAASHPHPSKAKAFSFAASLLEELCLQKRRQSV